jgi:DNA invertase Pin-like site-specific DNA recombinase
MGLPGQNRKLKASCKGRLDRTSNVVEMHGSCQSQHERLGGRVDGLLPMGELVFQLTGNLAEFEQTIIRKRIGQRFAKAACEGVC